MYPVVPTWRSQDFIAVWVSNLVCSTVVQYVASGLHTALRRVVPFKHTLSVDENVVMAKSFSKKKLKLLLLALHETNESVTAQLYATAWVKKGTNFSMNPKRIGPSSLRINRSSVKVYLICYFSPTYLPSLTISPFPNRFCLYLKLSRWLVSWIAYKSFPVTPHLQNGSYSLISRPN